MAIGRWISIVWVIMLVFLSTDPNCSGEREQDRDYLAQPANIPLFSNFQTPRMKPGDDGILNMSLTNRYVMNITTVNFTVEVYRYATIRDSKNLSEVSEPPVFGSTGTYVAYKDWDIIKPNETVTNVRFEIGSSSKTTGGTYFVRLQLSFEYNGSSYVMKSRGHFTDGEWKEATTNTTADDPGNINITRLSVDGIIPDTTFGVGENTDALDDLIDGFKLQSLIFSIGFIAMLRGRRRGNRQCV